MNVENQTNYQPQGTRPGSRMHLAAGFILLVSGAGVAALEVVLLMRHPEIQLRAIAPAALSVLLAVIGIRMMRRNRDVLAQPEENPEKNLREEAPPAKMVDIRAIIGGLIADWGGTHIYYLVLSMLVPLVLVLNGIPIDQDLEKLQALFRDDLFIGVVFLPVGFSFTVVGGYLAAWLSRSTNLLNAALVGSTGIVLSLFFSSESPLWLNYASVIGAVPAAMIGGFLYVKAWRFT